MCYGCQFFSQRQTAHVTRFHEVLGSGVSGGHKSGGGDEAGAGRERGGGPAARGPGPGGPRHLQVSRERSFNSEKLPLAVKIHVGIQNLYGN